MSESKAAGARERLSTTHAQSGDAGSQASYGGSATILSSTHPISPAQTGAPEPDLTSAGEPGGEVPPRLRFFSSLRTQLLGAYSLILLVIVGIVLALTYHRLSIAYIVPVALGTIILGAALAFLVINVLLRPLRSITDTAQAIAVGDLQQRERLPVRQSPQDEIGRLASSLNKMVTRLEYAQEMQHASERRFQRFFSDASHQLRTPLTSIRGFTEVLMRGAKDDPETAARVLKRMKNESERMTTLINDLLTLARLDDGQPLKTQYVDLTELAEEGIEQARAQADDGRTISLMIATQQPLGLQADKDRIKQLLFILLDNALKHGRQTPDGMITLRLDREGKQVTIRVIDNGDGISPEDLEHIFDSFYRGQRQRSPTSKTASAPGAGLGLTIANAITHAHQGTISVLSEVGKGTEFVVRLPCVD
jgi:two-component system OmpR family sensor kinase